MYEKTENDQKSIRLLASIMFTDIVGYTAMMQENEAKAKQFIDRHRIILERLIPQHKGRILQFYGDGTLSIFGSVIESIECALEIQKELIQEPNVPLRIGVHIGDISYSDDSVYGDGVNIAARIQGKGVAGSVLFSDKVYDEIKNHPGFITQHIGLHELKNVKKPVNIYALINEPLSVPQSSAPVIKSFSDIKTVAVLPFVNMSADAENEYFSDGITEEIINSLANINGLNITSRTSSFAFKGKSIDVRKIGSELNVNYLLEGSVRKAGEKIKITAQLIDSSNGYHLWSESFNRNLHDIFEIQDEISNTIAIKLKQKLITSPDLSTQTEQIIDNVEAYNLYLKGLFYWNKWSPDMVKEAMHYFKKALEIIPDFSKAHCGMANAYVYLGALGFRKPRTVYPIAYEHTEKAIRYDPKNGEAYISSALIKLFYEYDLEGCNKDFQKGFKLKPGSGQLHYTYAFYLTAKNMISEALNEIELALCLDPLNLPINDYYAFLLAKSKRFKDALLQIERILEVDSGYFNSIISKGYVYYLMGEIEKALCLLEKHPVVNTSVKGTMHKGIFYAKLGNNDKALECINRLSEFEKANPELCLCNDKAYIFAALNDVENTYYNLKKSIEARNGGMIFVYKDHIFKDMIKDENIFNLLKENNLVF